MTSPVTAPQGPPGPQATAPRPSLRDHAVHFDELPEAVQMHLLALRVAGLETATAREVGVVPVGHCPWCRREQIGRVLWPLPGAAPAGRSVAVFCSGCCSPLRGDLEWADPAEARRRTRRGRIVRPYRVCS